MTDAPGRAWYINRSKRVICGFSYERRTPTYFFGVVWDENEIIGHRNTRCKVLRRFQNDPQGRGVHMSLENVVNAMMHDLKHEYAARVTALRRTEEDIYTLKGVAL